ncbi:peroxiredoxin [Pseudanabaena sp. FACHB-2040]|uniref:peroxiredoxin n=1 Tax=Pseudanabaena sp. FACHB-2040 TaxID=2692859 RepID=UPI0016825209|nr:peroxiredoxin [Pseudanabaena sp. FACHB-2040]MBD2257034.1 peroxiredoxin [Pseudanabaena sp. FACHB-2040]
MSRRALICSVLSICLVLITWLTGMAPAVAMGGPQVPIGEPAPAFTLPTNAGDGEISLADYQGQWVVLYFYPKDFTSGCTLEAQRFQRDFAQYQARNAQILGVSADDVDSHAEFCDSEGLEFPLLSDPKGQVSKAYGSWLGAMSLRHTYIIDPEGVMRARFLGVSPPIHSQEVLGALDELQGVDG